jgi:hypothetical protein
MSLPPKEATVDRTASPIFTGIGLANKKVMLILL